MSHGSGHGGMSGTSRRNHILASKEISMAPVLSIHCSSLDFMLHRNDAMIAR